MRGRGEIERESERSRRKGRGKRESERERERVARVTSKRGERSDEDGDEEEVKELDEHNKTCT